MGYMLHYLCYVLHTRINSIIFQMPYFIFLIIRNDTNSILLLQVFLQFSFFFFFYGFIWRPENRFVYLGKLKNYEKRKQVNFR